jgi:hypothetical protein
MADPVTAINETLQNEDRRLSGIVVTDNNGALVKFGINAAANPDLFDADHPDGPSLQEAVQRYRSVYWPSAFDSLSSQHIANQIFDLCVNVGRYHAAQLLQLAIMACGVTVTVDGVIGAGTVAAANSCDEAQLVGEGAKAAEGYYTRLAAAKPEDAKYLKSWLARLKGEATG